LDYLRIGTQLVFCAAVSSCLAGTLPSLADAADMATKAPPAAQSSSDTNSSVLWLGSDFKNDVSAGNIGGIYALNGNLDASGWLVRGQFTYVGYDFDTALAPSGTGHANFYEGSGAIGYQVTGNGFVASGLVGIDSQDYNINPAAALPSNISDRTGAVFFGRIATTGNSEYPSAIDGDYSTANNSFWVRGRTGARFGNFVLGPEVIGLGNNSFDEVRFGGYVSYDLSRYVILQGDAGYADSNPYGVNTAGARGGSGAYGGVTLVFLH
jgi:hypothetical protein